MLCYSSITALFQAKPFHPVILDVVEIVVRNIELCIAEGKLDGSVGIVSI